MVNDCFSFDGEVIGEGPDRDGGVDGRPITVDGELGEDGRRKGELLGELRDIGADLCAACAKVSIGEPCFARILIPWRQYSLSNSGGYPSAQTM